MIADRWKAIGWHISRDDVGGVDGYGATTENLRMDWDETSRRFMVAENLDTLAARIRWARVNGGFSQTDLASVLGVNRSTVAHWERNAGYSPTIDHLRGISVAVGVTASWLMDGDKVLSIPAGASRRPNLEGKMLELSRHLPVSFLINIVALMEAAESCL